MATLTGLAAATAAAVIGTGGITSVSGEPVAENASAISSAAPLYRAHCASCHGESLQGRGAPPLAGAQFRAKWNGRAVGDLEAITQEMPQGAPHSLPSQDYKALTGFILAANGYRTDSPTLAEVKPGAGAGAQDVLTVSAGAAPVVETIPLPASPKTYGVASGGAGAAERLIRAPGADWLTYNRDYRGQRFSPLAEITPGNVGRLAPKCIFQTGEVGSFQTSPLIQDGRLYLTTPNGAYAIDARTCRKIWDYTYAPQGAEGSANSRGLALYEGKVIRGAPDGHLYALDAETGKLLWDVWVADGRKGYALSAAVVAFDGKVYTGQAGGDRGATGRIHAFDVNTGKLIWTFEAVPTGDAPGAETWGGGQSVGGGGSWTSITVDPATHRLYVPIGNPGSDLDGSMRPGANLYSNSVVVLDADTGKLDWYVQQIPHDEHDWNTSAPPVLYEIGSRRFMATATKGGWLYIYDRDSHELIARSEISTHLNADQAPTAEGVRICPGTLGGAEWNGPAYDPTTRRLYVNSVDWCATFIRQPEGGHSTFGGSVRFDPIEQAGGWTRAFSAADGKPLWADKADAPMVAGVTPTAGGLVFTGSSNGDFQALDARNGAVLYRFNTGGAVSGGVSTYSVDGRQYVAVASGNASRTIWKTRGAATIVVFGLP
jgi:PQQ-dependent dehydrogenase (methanol/ethanol family)